MSKTTDALKDAAIALGWTYPMFLPALGYVEFVEDTTIPTLRVNEAGLMKVNPDFLKGKTDRDLASLIFHEIGHLLLQHHSRCGGRAVPRWNRAVDRAWNQALSEMGIDLHKLGGIYPRTYDQCKMTAEELYDLEPAEPSDNDPQYQPGPAQGCGVDPDDGDGEGEGGEGGAPKHAEDSARKWGEIAAQVAALAAGTEHAQILARALAIPRPKVRWEQVLRAGALQARDAHGRDSQTWTKRSRRSPPNGALPGWTAAHARVAVVIDTSGSVYDELLALAIAEVRRVAELSGLKIFLVLHDSIAYYHGWIKAGTQVADKVTGRGGTDAHEAYRLVGAAGRFDVVIHLTDGELSWPTPPPCRRFVVALLGSKSSRYRVDPPAGSLVIPTEID